MKVSTNANPVKQRPMSATIALTILCTLAQTRPDLVQGKKAKYLQVAKEMELPQSEIDKLNKFPS